VIDLKSYLEIVNDLKKDVNQDMMCHICNKVCDYFIYDKKVFELIKNYPEYQIKCPHTLVIEENGSFGWAID
jgi:hypothetical protein